MQNFVWKKYFCNGNNLFTSEVLIHVWIRVGFSNIYCFVCKYFYFNFRGATENFTISIPDEFIYPIKVFLNSKWRKCLQSTFSNIYLYIHTLYFGSFPCHVIFYRKSKGRRWMLICGCIWQNKVTRWIKQKAGCYRTKAISVNKWSEKLEFSA